MRNKKAFFSLLLALALLFGQLVPAVAEDSKTVNIGVTSTLTTLSPLAMDNTEIVKYAASLVFLPLVELNRELEFVPQLAESITTEDNLNFVITLREGAAWSDGTPVTAEDVEYTLVLAADPDTANASLAMYAVEGTDDGGLIERGAQSISGVKVQDEKTLTVTMKWPTALYTFENNFGRYLLTVPKHVVEKLERESLLTNPWFNQPDVISGPYFIQQADLQHYVHFVANESYFLGAPKIRYLNMNVVSAAQMLSGLTSGEIDLVQQTMGSIPVEDYEAVRNLAGVKAVRGTPVTNESIFINTARVSDARIRKALLLGMDRESMFDALLEGNGELVDGFLVSASPYFAEDLGVTAYDPEEARRLVDEAKADGAETNLTWYVNSSESTWGQAVEYFAAMFEEIGLHIEIRTVDLANLMDIAGNGEHDIMSVEYTYAPVDPYTDVAWLLGGEGSWTGYSTDEVAQALALTQELTDVDEITQQFLVVDRAMQDDVAMISGWVLASLGAVNERVTGAEPDVFGTFVDVQNWDIQ
ncbi:MAG: ABC transporter substrate-binding protein [Clostridia bacterium]|nr:ABC transporter substrate-binding protein [Clostridia bacterium]